jgi:hypothetical protein
MLCVLYRNSSVENGISFGKYEDLTQILDQKGQK